MPLRGPARRRASVQPPAALKARGLRSREQLKRAARVVLNERGYRALRVQDVTERAGVATGLFYRYFHDLREIVAELATDFFKELLADADPVTEHEHPYDWIFQTLNVAVSRFSENPGIVACLFGLAGDYEEFDQIWKRNAHEWNLHVAAFLQRDAGISKARAERLGFVLGAITEGVLYQALVRRTEDLIAMGDKPEDVADVLAVMWYRSIFLEDPPRERLRPAGRLLVADPARGNRSGKRSGRRKPRV